MAVKSTKFLGRKIYLKHELLMSLVKDKKVIHFGCVDDNKRIIEYKIKRGFYLHKQVTEASKNTIGIDLNKGAFPFLKKLGIDNVYYGDVEDPSTFDIDKRKLKQAEVLLIPDLIEHLNNPGNMLEGIKKYFNPNIKVYILTPNPAAWYNSAATLLNREIYTDYHTIYFTTESMKILLDRYGFKINKILPVVSPKQNKNIINYTDKIVGKVATFISPAFADLYLYECVIKKNKA